MDGFVNRNREGEYRNKGTKGWGVEESEWRGGVMEDVRWRDVASRMGKKKRRTYMLAKVSPRTEAVASVLLSLAEANSDYNNNNVSNSNNHCQNEKEKVVHQKLVQ